MRWYVHHLQPLRSQIGFAKIACFLSAPETIFTVHRIDKLNFLVTFDVFVSFQSWLLLAAGFCQFWLIFCEIWLWSILKSGYICGLAPGFQPRARPSGRTSLEARRPWFNPVSHDVAKEGCWSTAGKPRAVGCACEYAMLAKYYIIGQVISAACVQQCC